MLYKGEDMPDSLNFQRSITQELEAVKNRVRDLIGSANWPEEGRYKESILNEAINSQIPNQISTGTGFIIKQGSCAEEFILSKQHDIILYDNRTPLIMKYGDFVVTTPSNVKGVIEVKANLSPNKFRDAFEKLERSLEDIFDSYNDKFIGIFSFDYQNNNNDNLHNIENSILINTLKQSKGIVNHISLGELFFIRFWKKQEGHDLNPPVQVDSDFYNIYNIDSLSYSYFISNILHSTCKDLDDRYWHSFPIIGTKEQGRIDTIAIDNNLNG